MVDKKRIISFILIVVLGFSVIGVTSPDVIRDIRLGLDLQGGFEILYKAKPIDEEQKLDQKTLEQAAYSLFLRADSQGVSEPEVFPEGSDRIRVRLAGVENQDELRNILKKPAVLEFRSSDGCESVTDYCKVELRGNDFVEGGASAQFDSQSQAIVAIKLKDADKFKEITTRLVGKRLAIYLDGELQSDPVVNYPITGGEATITGQRTYTEAQNLANIINLGALPVELEELYTQSVGATLGQEALKKTVTAGVIGSLIVILFMIIFYRLPGLIAVLTLGLYAWLILLVMGWMDATLTLPGIAAFVLGVGMAVDANIITSERIREEIRSGKSILSSLIAGSKNSFRAILDANLTSILAALVLYYLGMGAIQGFALILIISIIASMLTNVLLSRLLLFLLVRSKLVNKPSFFGVKESEISDISESAEMPDKFNKLDFVKYRKRFFLLSAIVLFAGVVSFGMFGMNTGVDFSAGTTLDIVIEDGSTTSEKAAELIKEATNYEPVITIGGADNNRVSSRFSVELSEEERINIINLFEQTFGEGKIDYQENTVNPAIAKELVNKAIIAVLLASVGILIYVSIRFEWRFALATVISLLHNALIVIGIFSIFKLQVDLPFIAAVLTVIGYSINDTIIIFDRIRENLRFAKVKNREDLKAIVNSSIRQTLTRTINTSATTILITLMLLLFGSEAIRLFSLALVVGLVSGVYSSLFIASQLWLLFKGKQINKEKAVAN